MATQPTTKSIKVANPSLEGNAKTYMTQDVDVADTSIYVSSPSGFPTSSSFFVLIGVYGDEKSEIKLVSNVNGKVMTIAALSNSHEASDPVTFIQFDKINYYGLESEAGTPGASPTSSVSIDSTSQFTEYTYTGTDYEHFTTAYFNSSDDTISGYSEVVSIASFTRRSVERIIKSGALKALTQIDENPGSRLTLDIALTILQDGLDEISASKKRWPFWNTISTGTSTVADQNYIDKPSDLTQLIRLKINNNTLSWISGNDYAKYTSTESQEKGSPYYFTEKNEKYYLYPTPSSVESIEYEYYKVPDVINNMSTEIAIPLVPVLIYYCGSQFAYIRGNEKKGDSLYQMYVRLLEEQKEEYGGAMQDSTAEYIEQSSGLSDENFNI